MYPNCNRCNSNQNISDREKVLVRVLSAKEQFTISGGMKKDRLEIKKSVQKGKLSLITRKKLLC